MSPILRLVVCIVCSMGGLIRAEDARAWHFLQSEHLKLGVDLGAGACIGWFSTAQQPEKNLLDTYDRGRYVQQSYYGDDDGSDWNGKPWRYNPVQGGDWHGLPAKVIEFKAESATKLHAKTQPRHWANGKALDECVMEQWITLEGTLAHVKFRFAYNGTLTHKPHHQELPAFYVQPEFHTLVFCNGTPWTNAPLIRQQPGEKNEYIKLTEPWVAWADKDDSAIGLLTGGRKQATCFRVPGPAACSYVAPIETFALTPGLVFEHEVWIGAGRVGELRERFRKVLHP